MNTQHFESAPNFIGRAPHALPPSTKPLEAALAMVTLAARPRRERHVPRITRLGLALHQLFPRSVERAIHHIVSNWHFGRTEPPETQGNLWKPSTEPARIAGKRPPQISLPRLMLWFVFGRNTRRRVTAAAL